MRKFGFSEKWIDIIWRSISSCWFSVLVNGESCGFFHSSRGLRKGLSPSIFIIAAEVLNRGLNHIHHPYFAFEGSRYTPMVSHLAYADDVIIFCNGEKRSLERQVS